MSEELQKTTEKFGEKLLPLNHEDVEPYLAVGEKSRKLFWNNAEIATVSSVRLEKYERRLALLTVIFVAIGSLGALITGVKDFHDMWGSKDASKVGDTGGGHPPPVDSAKQPDLSGINFESKSWTLTAAARPSLDRAVNWLIGDTAACVVIHGYADGSGEPQENLPLSEKRAVAVKKWFVDIGKIEGSRVSTRGHGAESPINSNESVEGRAKNRRAEIIASQCRTGN